jgi:diaminopimelate decarboxylase
MDKSNWLINKIEQLSKEKIPVLKQTELENYILPFIEDKDKFIDIADRFGSPLYLLDLKSLNENLNAFSDALLEEIPNNRIYFAMKSCNHPEIIRFLVKQNCGIDVSSGKELELALNVKASDIIFSGPGKTDAELKLAVENNHIVTILIDSFGELKRLNQIALGSGKKIRAGVRLTTEDDGLWRKFGIPIDSLAEFWLESENYKNIDLCGIQFHTSWNRSPAAQCKFLEKLGPAIKSLPPKNITRIEFIDIGGGYWPSPGEWLQPEGTPLGQIKKVVLDSPKPALIHYHLYSTPIKPFFRAIAIRLHKHVFNLHPFHIYVEPGRWLANNAIHILLTVVDKKGKDTVIADGGINIIGWERFETDYCPIVNLSRPAFTERSCYIFGSLCTPHDIWGYSYFGDDIHCGDRLLIPAQGAYTYSLRQEFIKPIPRSVIVDRSDFYFPESGKQLTRILNRNA